MVPRVNRSKLQKSISRALAAALLISIFIGLVIWQLQRAADLQELQKPVIDKPAISLLDIAKPGVALSGSAPNQIVKFFGSYVASFIAPNQLGRGNTRESWEVGIVEMGANHQKEIEFLCEIAKPDYGYITNFGKAHLEGFGGVEGVIKGKSEMYNFLYKNHKTAFVNLNDPIQVEKTGKINSFTFGLNIPNADVIINSITANPFVEVEFNNIKITSNLIGLYNSNNINAAISSGSYKTDIETIFLEHLESIISAALKDLVIDTTNVFVTKIHVRGINSYEDYKISKDKLLKLIAISDLEILSFKNNTIEYKATIMGDMNSLQRDVQNNSFFDINNLNKSEALNLVYLK